MALRSSGRRDKAAVAHRRPPSHVRPWCRTAGRASMRLEDRPEEAPRASLGMRGFKAPGPGPVWPTRVGGDRGVRCVGSFTTVVTDASDRLGPDHLLQHQLHPHRGSSSRGQPAQFVQQHVHGTVTGSSARLLLSSVCTGRSTPRTSHRRDRPVASR